MIGASGAKVVRMAVVAVVSVSETKVQRLSAAVPTLVRHELVSVFRASPASSTQEHILPLLLYLLVLRRRRRRKEKEEEEKIREKLEEYIQVRHHRTPSCRHSTLIRICYICRSCSASCRS